MALPVRLSGAPQGVHVACQTTAFAASVMRIGRLRWSTLTYHSAGVAVFTPSTTVTPERLVYLRGRSIVPRQISKLSPFLSHFFQTSVVVAPPTTLRALRCEIHNFLAKS